MKIKENVSKLNWKKINQNIKMISTYWFFRLVWLFDRRQYFQCGLNFPEAFAPDQTEQAEGSLGVKYLILIPHHAQHGHVTRV